MTTPRIWHDRTFGGLVEVGREARQRVCRLRLEPLTEVDEWLGRYRALWQQRLHALHTEVA